MHGSPEGNKYEKQPPGVHARPAPLRVEAGFNTRMDIWQHQYENHMKKFCNKKGEQVQSNLSVDQQLALKSLSTRFVVVPEDMYAAMGRDYTSKDKPVTLHCI